MKITDNLSDQIILQEIGARIVSRRLNLQQTQETLAKQAGVGKRTLERIESGESTQTISVIRVLRVLGLLSSLDAALPAVQPSPMALLEAQGKQRKRASGKKRKNESEQEWSWGEDQ